MKTQFFNRTEAGQFLAENLSAYANRDDVLVLALPRGGVPVAAEVAEKTRRAARCVCCSQARLARSYGTGHGRHRLRWRARVQWRGHEFVSDSR